MQDFLFQYHGVSPTTWVYLSSLLMIGLFFKFGRFWSIRNLDLVLLILLAPGLLLIHYGNHIQSVATSSVANGEAGGAVDGAASQDSAGAAAVGETDRDDRTAVVESPAIEQGQHLELTGYVWLFALGGVWLIRLLLDPAMIRRPLLVPNLSVGGLTFIGVFLFVFLMANVVSRRPVDARRGAASPSIATDAREVARMDAVLAYQQERGPGYAALNALPIGARKTIAIFSHLAVVIGLVLIGYRHFDNMTNGIGAAMLYLMLPYTSQMTGRVDHVLPAAFLVWAVLCYRRPIVSGCLMGAACGCIYYPLFALPTWISFYWSRGMFRFMIGIVVVLALMSLGLVLLPESQGFLSDLQRMFGVVTPAMKDLEGLWNKDIGGFDPYFRLPVLAGFVVLSFGLALWPSRKNLGTIICYTAAIMLASQFWHGYGGGLYMAWYLPLVLLTIFRPNLEDRVAQAVIVDGWFSRRSHVASARSLAA